MATGKYQKWLEPDGLLLLEAWARDGLTDEQIAGKCDVAVSTLYEWKKRYSEISEALKKGKEVVDVEVENALLQRTKGYTIPLRKTFKCKVIDYMTPTPVARLESARSFAQARTTCMFPRTSRLKSFGSKIESRKHGGTNPRRMPTTTEDCLN